jgi:hypothetical protein
MTLAVGGGTYVNIRGRAEPMTCSGYEHFGLRLASSEDVEAAWAALDEDGRDVNLEPLDRGRGRLPELPVPVPAAARGRGAVLPER